MYYKILSLIIILIIAISGCNYNAVDKNKTQIANPASTFCIENGGKLIIKESSDGQYANCLLADGKECEEWAFYRGECPKVCAECPKLAMPSPDFCPDGDIVSTKDECGCDMPPKCLVKGATYCKPEQRNVDFCTMEYRPVCGMFDSTIKCVRYPCGITASNPCMACANPQVEYWVEGECK